MTTLLVFCFYNLASHVYVLYVIVVHAFIYNVYLYRSFLSHLSPYSNTVTDF